MISQQEIDSIVNVVETQGLTEELVKTLRSQYENYHFTYCMDDDMDAYSPAIEKDGFNIYFVNSADHCAVLTNDPEKASGLVLAEVIGDDE